jgi:hypothetical protein
VREIRKLRSTWRGQETRYGRDTETLADERASQQETQTSTYTGAPVLDPTVARACSAIDEGAGISRIVQHLQNAGMAGRRP